MSTAYRIVGASDCPYFARCERLAALLQAHLQLTPQQIQVEMKVPSMWNDYMNATCKVLCLVSSRPLLGGVIFNLWPTSQPVSSDRFTAVLSNHVLSGVNACVLVVHQLHGFQEYVQKWKEQKRNDRVIVFHPVTGRLVGGDAEFQKEVADKYDITLDISWGMCQSIAQENVELFAKHLQHKLTRPLGIILAGASIRLSVAFVRSCVCACARGSNSQG